MRSPIRRFLDWWHRGEFYTNEEAATIIRSFVCGRKMSPYDWDDFTSCYHANPEADLAVRTIFHFEEQYPSTRSDEYCGREAFPYFQAVAGALEKGSFRSLDHAAICESLRKTGILPDEVKQILDAEMPQDGTPPL